MGGAEKWMIEMAEFVSRSTEAKIVDVAPQLSNFYGRLVLKRTFDDNSQQHRKYEFGDITSLSASSFLPFSTNWHAARNIFTTSQIIYARMELLEVLLCVYFGGFGVFKKLVAGLHMSIFYEQPANLTQLLHNLVYTSAIFRHVLAACKKVHVINQRDQKYLLQNFRLTNVFFLPNGTDVPKVIPIYRQPIDKRLHIIFVGELSLRKGIDTILETIKISPADFQFAIIGQGPLKKEVMSQAKKSPNLHFYGYVKNRQLEELYRTADVIFFPSRAEAFGLVMIEAMANGLMVVNSPEVTLHLPDYIEKTVAQRDPQEYVAAFKEILARKNKKLIDRKKINQYCYQHFSKEIIYPKFVSEVLG